MNVLLVLQSSDDRGLSLVKSEERSGLGLGLGSTRLRWLRLEEGEVKRVAVGSRA